MQNIWTEVHRKRNMVLKHMKECLISSRVRKMQVKTVLITYQTAKNIKQQYTLC